MLDVRSLVSIDKKLFTCHCGSAKGTVEPNGANLFIAIVVAAMWRSLDEARDGSLGLLCFSASFEDLCGDVMLKILCAVRS